MAHDVDLTRVEKLKSDTGVTILKAGWSFSPDHHHTRNFFSSDAKMYLAISKTYECTCDKCLDMLYAKSEPLGFIPKRKREIMNSSMANNEDIFAGLSEDEIRQFMLSKLEDLINQESYIATQRINIHCDLIDSLKGIPGIGDIVSTKLGHMRVKSIDTKSRCIDGDHFVLVTLIGTKFEEGHNYEEVVTKTLKVSMSGIEDMG